MDAREKYKERLKIEAEKNKENRLKRDNKKKAKDLQFQSYLESLKDHSTGLITWKNKSDSLWDGYVKDKKTFKLSFGIHKYSLSLHPGVEVSDENKKDKTPKTSFDIDKLKTQAESIAKRLSKQNDKASSKI
jgi:hypothetical protein